MNPKKYDFTKQKLRFLRYIIFKDKIRIDPEKIAKIVSLLSLINFKQLQFRLGLFLFYKKYIKEFLKITQLYKKLGYVFYIFCICFVYVFKKSMIFIRN